MCTDFKLNENFGEEIFEELKKSGKVIEVEAVCPRCQSIMVVASGETRTCPECGLAVTADLA